MSDDIFQTPTRGKENEQKKKIEETGRKKERININVLQEG